MIIQCESCQKKFIVPDSAVTAKGRLVQCSSCGNKWTQYPVKEKSEKAFNLKNISKTYKQKKTKPKKTIGVSVYSDEYLQKKHGIKIIDPSSSSVGSVKKQNGGRSKKINFGYGFFNYLITLFVVSVFFIGILSFEKDRLSRKFPFLEPYIDNFFETLNNFKPYIDNFFETLNNFKIILIDFTSNY